jgi:hypothetical protein
VLEADGIQGDKPPITPLLQIHVCEAMGVLTKAKAASVDGANGIFLPVLPINIGFSDASVHRDPV